MKIPEKKDYLAPLCDELAKRWPDNRTINIVCHGHSVPSGYACTPFVNTFHVYPYLVHRTLKERFPYAVMNVIVTAIGGEQSEQGQERFEADVLSHKPELITIDYGLNDRGIGLERAEYAWRKMIEAALDRNIRVMLMTPSWDQTYFLQDENWKALEAHAVQIRRLAASYSVALGDSFAAYERYLAQGGDLQDLLNHWNHPSGEGHRLIAREITSWFPAR